MEVAYPVDIIPHQGQSGPGPDCTPDFERLDIVYVETWRRSIPDHSTIRLPWAAVSQLLKCPMSGKDIDW